MRDFLFPWTTKDLKETKIEHGYFPIEEGDVGLCVIKILILVRTL